jgi:nicotinamide riboside transporter PnuC
MSFGANSHPSAKALRHTRFEEAEVPFRLDYLSCILTIASTILVGRRCWEGWILAAVNSVVICLIGFQTSQFGFIPANVFCIALYGVNLRSWRKPEEH